MDDVGNGISVERQRKTGVRRGVAAILAIGFRAVLILSVAVIGVVWALDLRPSKNVMAVPVLVIMASVAGYVAWHDFHVVRAWLWSVRWWWWCKRMGRWVARREALQSQGRCVACGYNLTGNVSGVCPECGRVAS